MGKPFTRREFIKKAAQGAAAASLIPAFVPARALGAEDKAPASERLGMGFIGVGGMGSGHLGAFLGRRECEILAVCDVYEPHRLRAKERVGGERVGDGNERISFQEYADWVRRPNLRGRRAQRTVEFRFDEKENK